VTVSEGFATPFVFPAGTTLAPQEYLVIVEDTASFTSTYSTVPTDQIAGQYDGSLSNGGETIRVEDVNGEAIVDFLYDDSFPWANADGTGQSLVLSDPDSNGNLAESWIAATPSPGLEMAAPAFLPGDVNQDGIVNFQDISPFISLLAASGYLEEADINGDGVVDFLDISPFIDELAAQ